MYAKAARELYSAGSDQQARADVLKDIREKLEKRRPDRDQFILAFEERFLFTNDYTRDKSFVQYVLERLLQHANPTTGVEIYDRAPDAAGPDPSLVFLCRRWARSGTSFS